MTYAFTIVIEPDELSFHAFVPELPGCHSHGDTMDDARKKIAEAIGLHVGAMLEDGEDIPIGTFRSILKDADLSTEEVRKLL